MRRKAVYGSLLYMEYCLFINYNTYIILFIIFYDKGRDSMDFYTLFKGYIWVTIVLLVIPLILLLCDYVYKKVRK